MWMAGSEAPTRFGWHIYIDARLCSKTHGASMVSDGTLPVRFPLISGSKQKTEPAGEKVCWTWFCIDKFDNIIVIVMRQYHSYYPWQMPMIHKRLHDLWFAATGMTQAQLTQIAVRLHHSFVLAIAEPQATACPLSTESPMRAKSGKPLVTAYQNHWISSNPLTGVKLHTFCLNNMFSCCKTVVLVVIPQSKSKYVSAAHFFPVCSDCTSPSALFRTLWVPHGVSGSGLELWKKHRSVGTSVV